MNDLRLERLVSRLVIISEFPSRSELQRFSALGVHRLVNVAGVRLSEVYPGLPLGNWLLSEHAMADVFSQAPSTLGTRVTASAYRGVAPLVEQEAFMSSVQAVVDSLNAMQTVAVFCRQGVGRSPAVVCAALHSALSVPLPVAAALVAHIRPQAVVSDVSLSASLWFAQVGRQQTTADRPSSAARLQVRGQQAL